MSRSNTTTTRKTVAAVTTKSAAQAQNNTTTSSSTGTPTPVRETRRRSSHRIKNYRFEYQRDRVSRRAESSYFRVQSDFDQGLDMTLQEAQSLYNFLGKMLNE